MYAEKCSSRKCPCYIALPQALLPGYQLLLHQQSCGLTIIAHIGKQPENAAAAAAVAEQTFPPAECLTWDCGHHLANLQAICR